MLRRAVSFFILFFASTSITAATTFSVDARFQEMEAHMAAGDYGKGRSIALELESLGDPRAFYTLGFLEAKRRTPEGDAAAFTYFKKAGEKDYPEAYFPLYLMYSQGSGTAEDKTKALYWLVRDVEGDRRNLFLLAKHYHDGDLGPVEREKAFGLFTEILRSRYFSNTEEQVMAAFHIGWMLVGGTEATQIIWTDRAFDMVLSSSISTPQVNWAKEEINTWQTRGLWAPDRGDGSEEHAVCKSRGYKSWSKDYGVCRQALLEMRKHEAEVERKIALAKAQIERAEEIARKQRNREQLSALFNVLAALSGQPNVPNKFISGSTPTFMGCRLVSRNRSKSYTQCNYSCSGERVTRNVGIADHCPIN
jgi:hypothetical protein